MFPESPHKALTPDIDSFSSTKSQIKKQYGSKRYEKISKRKKSKSKL